MNKLVIGIMVVVLGGVLGWYYFRVNPTLFGTKAPGLTNQQLEGSQPTGATGSSVSISDESTGGGTTKGGLETGTDVKYTDSGYSPKQITVKKGTAVTFQNDSSIGMWTASGVHPTHQLLPGFDELKSVAKGGTYTYTFTKVGTWQYHNHMKPTDLGVVVVTE